MKSTFGEVTLHLAKGYCSQRNEWIIPIREAWGLAKNQRLSPALQRRLCFTASETGSFEKASALAAEWGCCISDDAIRSCVVSLAEKAADLPVSAPCANRADEDDVLIIMMDGWMARHRGMDWGKKRRIDGQERVHWHEIKSAVIYRLKDQADVSPKRRALLSKHIVSTPAQTEPVAFGQHVQLQARRMGLGQARSTYVVMDGAVWLWNIFEDRFKQCAVGTLDFYHASKHLHALAAALFPEDKKEASTWCSWILHSLRHHSPKRLFSTLADLVAVPPRQDPETLAAIKSADGYFENHKDHMHYAKAAKGGLPIGSGSMESQCSQFQDRFKRRGQFWTKAGFAGLLEISVRHQNGELRSLWAA